MASIVKASGPCSSMLFFAVGLNNKIRVVTRRSYGFRTYEAMEIALYHTLGRLPEPETTHRFC
jgi:Transposase